METIYDYLSILLPVGLIVFYWIYKGIRKLYKWVEFKNKYPILSDSVPKHILSVGDEVTFVGSKTRYEYRGMSNTDDIYYVFMSDNSVTPVCFTISYVKNELDTIYGTYGIKWKRIVEATREATKTVP